MNDPTIDPFGAGLAGLILSARTLSELARKGLLTAEEAEQIVRSTHDQMEDPGKKALKVIFPNLPY